MEEILLGIIDTTLDYSTIGRLAIIYLLALWGMFSLWVFFDAKKRYENTALGVIFFLLVFIFNFPALIFYIVIRPEFFEANYHDHSNMNLSGGLNIPVANFIDKEGNVELTLNLKLNAGSINNNSLRVSIEGDKIDNPVNFSQQKSKETATISEPIEASHKEKLSLKVSKKFHDLKDRGINVSSKLLKEFKSYGDKIEKSDEIEKNDKDKSSEKVN